jgi:fructose-1-phosphate kinase PfkB-like protein
MNDGSYACSALWLLKPNNGKLEAWIKRDENESSEIWQQILFLLI